MSYLIKPFCMRTGNTAPGIISYADKPELAIEDAKSKSSLSKYKTWRFDKNVKHVKDKTIKRFKEKQND